jgi:hypothetical protein
MPPFTAVVAGALANKPGSGGEAWVRLNWTLGLERLGFRVLFVEQAGPQRPPRSAVEYFERLTARYGFEDAALLHGEETVAGLSTEAVREAAHGAELFINLSGNLRDLTLVEQCRRKIYVDLDPGYTQFWHASGMEVGLGGHDHYVTVGARIGDVDCVVPTSGIDWQPVAPPVVLDQWPVAKTAAGRFTTVATWRGAYGRAEYDSHVYGLKAHEFRKMRELPRRAPFVFEVALAIDQADEADRTALVDAGWRLVSPDEVAPDPERFRDYVRGSSAEFSVAQGIYVETECGWFSDRAAAYLAAGKPVLLQDTGFADAYRAAKGLVPFRTLDEAVAGATDIVSDYAEHCHAARCLAEEHFDSDVVLGRLLERVGASS